MSKMIKVEEGDIWIRPETVKKVELEYQWTYTVHMYVGRYDKYTVSFTSQIDALAFIKDNFESDD